MLAARLLPNQEGFELEPVEEPIIQADEVLINVRAASLCGTDVHLNEGMIPSHKLPNQPLIVGHEGAGVVEAVGTQVDTINVGDHVVVNYVTSCGDCQWCSQGFDNRCRHRGTIGVDRDGTFAEKITVPVRSALKIDDSVPFGWASLAGCAVATAYHAIDRSGLEDGDTIAVFGVGGVGQHVVLWADFVGAEKIVAIDPATEKLAAIETYGADITLDPEELDVQKRIRDATNGFGVDIAVECSGTSQAMKQAIQSVQSENRFATGAIVSVGKQVNPIEVNFDQLREGKLMVSGDHTQSDLRRIIELLECEDIELSNSITHTVPLTEIQKGIELMRNSDERVGRITIDTTK